jgi:hypothetical protein
VNSRSALSAILLLLTAGCLEDNRRQLAQCELDASRAHPGKSLNLMSDNYDHAVGDDVQLCMRAAGYVWDMRPDKCEVTDDRVKANPYCYRPSGTIDFWFFRAEILFGRLANL